MAATDFAKAFRVLADKFKKVAESATPNPGVLTKLKAEAMLRLRQANSVYEMWSFVPWQQYETWAADPMMQPSLREFGWAGFWDCFIASVGDREADFLVPDPLSTREVARENGVAVSISTGDIAGRAYAYHRACEWLAEQCSTRRPQPSTHRGRRVDDDEHRQRKAANEAWIHFKENYRQLGYSRASYENCAMWCHEHRDDMPLLDEQELKRLLKAFRDTPEPKR